jgi:cyanobactin maturation PatA/PatG family protease
LIFGQHHSDVHGVAPRCRGAIIPVFRERDDGTITSCSQLDLARAISLAVAVGANVINISAGRFDETGQPEPPLARALKLCADHGILIVASVGNEGCACPHVPAASPSVLAVGSMDPSGDPSDFSNWGELYRGHAILAPGENIAGAAPGGGVALASGTSLSTAVVSGIAGLLLSLQFRRGRQPDVAAVRSALLRSAVGCNEQPVSDCQRVLAGRLNILGALALICEGESNAMSISDASELSGSCGSTAQEDQQKTPCNIARETDRSLSQAGKQGSPPATDQRLDQTVLPGTTAVDVVRHATEREDGSADLRSSDTAGHLAYVLGQIAYDFGTEARRDALVQKGLANPADQAALLQFLQESPWEAISVIWVLAQESTPIYALQPSGPFAKETYNRIRVLLRTQIEEGVSQVSIPGVLRGEVTLMNGHTVPVIAPDIRGMFGWSTSALIEAVLGPEPEDEEELAEYRRRAGEVSRFLDRLYYELANLGVAPQDRAVNYAATNIYQVASVYQEALEQNLRLDNIALERSPVCRPGSDCWDVKLTLFDPSQRFERAREVYRLTVDVSEVIPVTVGKLRHWSVY